MNIGDIATAVTNVGFPVVWCVLMAFMVYKMQAQHKEETDKMTEALNNNNLLLHQILERLRIDP